MLKVAALALAAVTLCSNAAAQTRVLPVSGAKPDPASLYEQAYKLDVADGAQRDAAKALALYRQAADLGSTDAMLRIGYLYANGRSVPLDHAQAADWYRRAGDSGHSKAMFMIGVCYWAGRGVPEDQVEAYKWIDLAATYAEHREQETAANTRTALARVMTPAQIEDGKRRSREWQIAFERRRD